jgi:hypothetical protein
MALKEDFEYTSKNLLNVNKEAAFTVRFRVKRLKFACCLYEGEEIATMNDYAQFVFVINIRQKMKAPNFSLPKTNPVVHKRWLWSGMHFRKSCLWSFIPRH